MTMKIISIMLGLIRMRAISRAIIVVWIHDAISDTSQIWNRYPFPYNELQGMIHMLSQHYNKCDMVVCFKALLIVVNENVVATSAQLAFISSAGKKT